MRLLPGLLLSATLVTAPIAQTASAAPTRVFVSGHSLTDLPMPDYLARVAVTPEGDVVKTSKGTGAKVAPEEGSPVAVPASAGV